MPLTVCPDMPKHERLACVTFSILEAMNRVDKARLDRQSSLPRPLEGLFLKEP